jgi:hypothetical protein
MANTVSLNQLPSESAAPAGGVLHCYDPTQPVGLRDVQLAVSAFQGAFSAQTANTVYAGPVSGGSTLPSFRALVTADMPATVALLASPTFTGVPAAPTASVDTNTTQLATTAYVIGQGYLKATAAASTYAPLASPTLTGTPSAPTAAAGTSTGQLATTAFLTQPGPIGSVAPNTGKFTTLQATGAITPSSVIGIVGTTTNDNVNAGSIGEFVSTSSSGTSMTSNVTMNATSTTLTAGDWDVTGIVAFHPAGTTTINALMAGISTTSATAGPLGTLQRMIATFQTGVDGNSLQTPTVRLSLTANTAVYVVATAQFGASTMTCDGFIRARRVR